MDSIRIFLENMFYGIKESPSVLKAKRELLSMMEDKYTELKEEGLSENEAVGQVISEFGNLEELADDLGIREDISASQEDQVKAANSLPLQYLRDNEVDDFLIQKQSFGNKIAWGTLLGILSPCGILAIGAIYNNDNITDLQGLPGIILFFIVLAVSIGFFIIAGISNERIEKLDKKLIQMNEKKRKEIEGIYEAERAPFAKTIAIAVGLILVGVAIMVSIQVLGEESARWTGFGVITLMLFIAVSVFMMIKTGIRRGSLELLLNTGSYSLEERRADSFTNKISGPYWLLVTVGYLAWSFISTEWDRTWIVWPIAGVVYALIASIANSVSKE